MIQARLTSKRLPKKILKKIGGKTVLQHCFDNVSKSKLLDEVHIITPHKIKGYDTKVIVGYEDDVLSRYYYASVLFGADVIVRITSDCPFIDHRIIDMAINYYFDSHLGDYSGYVCFAPIDGLDVEVFSFYRLTEAFYNAKDSYDREHVTPYIRRITKLSIDTQEDLEKARKWWTGKTR